MAPRKGNMMTVRNDIKVLDATIRDGGLCNNFEFTDEFVTELYKTNIKSGVDYMEFGYRASKKMFDPENSANGNSARRKIYAVSWAITFRI